MAGQRPLLVGSRMGDADQKVQFAEGNWLEVPGGDASAKIVDSAIYLAASVRNVGTGLAVLHGWHILLEQPNERTHPPLEEFIPQIRDIYVRRLRGRQRVISQFSLRYQTSGQDGSPGRWLASASSNFDVDRPDPR
jgi:hypothetical protein